MNFPVRLLVAGSVLALCAVVDTIPGMPMHTGVVGNAEAIIGRPFTPFSYAGVARRSVYRRAAFAAPVAVAATAAVATTAVVATSMAAASQQGPGLPVGTVVSQLPENCVSSPSNGVEYYTCNGVSYRSAFQGNNLVYVVSGN